MEFIDWIAIPQLIMRYFFAPEVSSAAEWVNANLLYLKICLITAAGLYAVGLVFGGLGLYSMAKRAGVPNAWMGFVPFLNTLLIGKLAGEANIFGKKIKRVGLYVMLLEILYVGIYVFSVVLLFGQLNPAYVGEVYRTVGEETQIIGYEIKPELFPLAMRWVSTAETVLEALSYLVYIVLLFMLFTMFSAFFRKYYARSPFMMTFFCAVLPVRGFVIFAVRNNTPVDYDAYMQARMREFAEQQQRGGMGTGMGTGMGSGSGSDEPFRDFSSAPPPPPKDGGDDSPFSDF